MRKPKSKEKNNIEYAMKRLLKTVEKFNRNAKIIFAKEEKGEKIENVQDYILKKAITEAFYTGINLGKMRGVSKQMEVGKLGCLYEKYLV